MAPGGNPFEFVRPLLPLEVQGRGAVADQVLRGVRDRRLVALVGPRRHGKTSLLGVVAATAADVDDLETVAVDCFGVASTGEFAVRLEQAMSALAGPARKIARRLLESSELGLSISAGVGFKASFGRRDAPEPLAALHGLLSALVALSERRGGLLVVLDEFQDVARVEGLDAVLRTHLQHAHHIAVLFAGSKPSLLRALFEDRARPFYGQAELVEVGPLGLADAARIVEGLFEQSGRDAGDAGELVARAVRGHPQRLMLVGHLLWELVAEGGTADAESVGAAIEEAQERTAPEHQAVVDGLDRTHRDTLRAVVSYGSPYARAAERTLGLRGAAQSAVRALEDEALLVRRDGRWSLVDPFLESWLARRLPAPGAT